MRKLWYGRFKWIKRILLIGIALGVLGICAVFGINRYMESSVSDFIFQREENVEIPKVDCIMVLGAGLQEDGKPSLVLRDRLERGVELYKQGVSDRLLMTGDHGRNEYDEVAAMKQYAVDAGVPAEHIFMDHAGFSTYESMYRARDVFEVQSLAIVTQPYHVYRAVYAAKELGMTAYGTPSKETIYRGSWMLEWREKLARTKDFVWLIVKPEPTYLGDKISIHGTGTATEDK